MAKQRQAKKKLGFLSSASFKELEKPVTAFRRGMKDAGFVEDNNVKVTYQWANHNLERLPELARKLVEAGVDVIAATGGIAAAQAAVNATRNASTTKQARVVFVCGSNPVGANDRLGGAGGNVTGVITSTAESLPDRLKLLEKMVNNKKAVPPKRHSYINFPEGVLSISRVSKITCAMYILCVVFTCRRVIFCVQYFRCDILREYSHPSNQYS